MKLAEVPEGSRFLDVDGIAVVMLPEGRCVAFEVGPGAPDESRPYPNVFKAGSEGDALSREEFAAWLAPGRNRFDMPAKPEPTVVSPDSAQPTMRDVPGLSPEMSAQMDEYSRKLGEALVANLNRNARRDSGEPT